MGVTWTNTSIFTSHFHLFPPHFSHHKHHTYLKEFLKYPMTSKKFPNNPKTSGKTHFVGALQSQRQDTMLEMTVNFVFHLVSRNGIRVRKGPTIVVVISYYPSPLHPFIIPSNYLSWIRVSTQNGELFIHRWQFPPQYTYTHTCTQLQEE